MRTIDISLIEVFKKYTGRTNSDFIADGKNRYKTTCHKHKDSDPSLLLFDKTAEGKGWDYHCFVCKAHGSSPDLLVDLGITDKVEDSEERLREDFDLKLPDTVTLLHFCDLKGIDADFASKNGWHDVKGGMMIEFYDENQDIIAKKVRVKYTGKDKYYYVNWEDGLQDNPAYGLHWVPSYDDVLYICEGETDTITLRQAGFPAIGIPSTNAWNPKYTDKFNRFTKIVIVRDNDTAGQQLVNDVAQSFPDKTYIKSPYGKLKDINDVHIYACHKNVDQFREVFSSLEEYPATVETFMKELESNPFLMEDKKALAVIYRELTVNPARTSRYIERIVEIAKLPRRVVNECFKQAAPAKTVASDQVTEQLLEEEGCYKKIITHNNITTLKKITNFVARLQYQIESDGDITRVVQLINEFGTVSRNIHLDSDDLTQPTKLSSAFCNAGNFMFAGSDTFDVILVGRAIIAQTSPIIRSPKYIGKLERGGWLFGNCAVDKAGEISEIADGRVAVDGEIYSPKSITIDDNGSNDMPMFNVDMLTSADDTYLRAVLEKLRKSFGSIGTWLGLGWCVAGWFHNAVYKKYGFFPIMFVSGKRNSGKSTLCSMLYSSFGFSAASGMSIETPTVVGILRYLGYRSSLPQWYDDYRNGVPRIQQKDGMLIDLYNMHGATKGVANSDSVRSSPIRGYVLLSGEDTPQNNALLTRCCVVQVSEYDRTPEGEGMFEEVKYLMENLKYAGLKWCIDSQSTANRAKFLGIVQEVSERIKAEGVDARFADNHAIMAAGLLFGFGHIMSQQEKDEFLSWLCQSSVKEKTQVDSEHPVAHFLNDLAVLINNKAINYGTDFLMDGSVMALRIREAHHEWSGYNKNIGLGAVLKERTLRDYLIKEPFVLGEKKKTFPNGSRFYCFEIDLSKMGEEYNTLKETVKNFKEDF